MSAEDRATRFERALARHLRDRSPDAGCADAETLAAYHERSLSLEEMAHWKQHIAGCAVCQETLALVEITEKQLGEDWERQRIPALAPPAVPIARKQRPALVRWAIPLGAAAAGVLVWIGIHEQSAMRHAATVEKFQVAENRPQAAPVPPGQYEGLPKTETQIERHKEASRLDAGLATNAPTVAPVQKSKKIDEQKAGASAAGDSLSKDEYAAKKVPATGGAVAGGAIAAAPSAVAALTSPPPPPPAPKPAAKEQAPPAVTETVEVTPAAPAVSASGQQPVDLPTGQGAGSAPDDQKHVAALSKSKSAMQQSADVNTNAMDMKQGITGRNYSSLRSRAPATPVILTPNNKVWWKLATGGSVELTTDAGKTWTTRNTGVSSQLTSGSAPSSKVCWMAGQAGTLLLTKDRGNHWTKLTTPITGDLGGVHAMDAKHATIWDTANRLSYETSDAGATWKQIANE